MVDLFIDSKPYEKRSGTTCFAPYVDVSMCALMSQKSLESSFKARIDTGADITCIPESQAGMLMPLLRGRPVLTRAHDGSIKRVNTYKLIISVCGYPDEGRLESYQPERGVLLTDSDIGLIGMDVISKYWKVTFDGVSQKFSVECT